MALAAQCIVCDVAEPAATLRVPPWRLTRALNPVHALGVAHMFRAAQEQAIGDAEHCGIHANAEGKRSDDRRAERALPPESAPAHTNVAPGVSYPRRHIPSLLSNLP